MSEAKSIMVVGASGLVGGEVLRQALMDDRVGRIVAPVRRELGRLSEAPNAQHKLETPRVDFDNLADAALWWQVDAVICTLGTTRKAAGTKAAFRRVDHDYPLAVADIARRHGVTTYVLNSAMGADASSRWFYNRVKGDLETALAERGFTSLTLVRPGLIGGKREQSRPLEAAAGAVLGALGPILPRHLRVCPAPNIAQALLMAALDAAPGQHRVGAERLS
ncbi:NAD(P)H-binding protein [Halomonas sp. V046]|uniref:NAD(P)H-binding protein n=1 Tax=Halomonas sp. V046 TaxID=3459611 RepID=UPI0040440A23